MGADSQRGEPRVTPEAAAEWKQLEAKGQLSPGHLHSQGEAGGFSLQPRERGPASNPTLNLRLPER